MKRCAMVWLLALCLLLAGCGAREAEEARMEDPTILLGFSQLGWESAWRLANTQSIKSAAEAAGVTLMYDADDEQ